MRDFCSGACIYSDTAPATAARAGKGLWHTKVIAQLDVLCALAPRTKDKRVFLWRAFDPTLTQIVLKEREIFLRPTDQISGRLKNPVSVRRHVKGTLGAQIGQVLRV